MTSRPPRRYTATQTLSTLAEAVYGFVRASVEQNPDGTPGLFGPPVEVAQDAPLLDRIIGLTGRDPAWRAPGA